jgi:hypothetical protein
MTPPGNVSALFKIMTTARHLSLALLQAENAEQAPCMPSLFAGVTSCRLNNL